MQHLLSMGMFDYLRYYTKVEYEVLNIFHGGMIIAKRVYVAYIF